MNHHPQRRHNNHSRFRPTHASSSGNASHGGVYNAKRVIDSAGPDGKVRGTALQVYEKYLAQARDAHTGGDRVLSENCLQHAEHYLRLMNGPRLRGNGELPPEEVFEEDDRFADLRRERQEAPPPVHVQPQPQPAAYASQPQPSFVPRERNEREQRNEQPRYEGPSRREREYAPRDPSADAAPRPFHRRPLPPVPTLDADVPQPPVIAVPIVPAADTPIAAIPAVSTEVETALAAAVKAVAAGPVRRRRRKTAEEGDAEA